MYITPALCDSSCQNRGSCTEPNTCVIVLMIECSDAQCQKPATPFPLVAAQLCMINRMMLRTHPSIYAYVNPLPKLALLSHMCVQYVPAPTPLSEGLGMRLGRILVLWICGNDGLMVLGTNNAQIAIECRNAFINYYRCTVVNGAMNNSVKLEPQTTEWNQSLYKVCTRITRGLYFTVTEKFS